MAELGKEAFDEDDSLTPLPLIENQDLQDPSSLGGTKSKI